MAISESVTEQYKDELGFDPKIHSLRSCAAVQAFVKALEKSGTLDSSVEIDILKPVEKLDSVIGKLRFNESVIFGGLLMRFTRYVALRLASGLLRLNDNNEKILQKNRKLLERSRIELEFNINLSMASA